MMTMIEELAQFLGRLIFLKETRRLDVAGAEIGEFCARLFERTPEQLRSASYEELIAFAREQGVRTGVALGCILKEMGDIARLRENVEDACGCYIRALTLMLDAYGMGDTALPLETPERIEILIDAVEGCELPPTPARLLAGYFEHEGFFADAEDLIFDMVHNGVPGAVDDGVAFYERLAGRDDADLQNGNLPREEVEEGMHELMRLKQEGQAPASA